MREAVGEAAGDFVKLGMDRRVDGAVGGVNDERTGSTVGIGLYAHSSGLRGRQDRRERISETRVDGDAVGLRAGHPVEGDARYGYQGILVDRELAVEDSFRDQNREFHDIAFGPVAKIRTRGQHVGGGTIQALDYGLKFGAAALLSVAQTGVIGLALFALEPLLHFGDRVISDRVLFGSAGATSGADLASLIQQVRDLPLREATIEKWLGVNALRVLGRS